MDASKVLLLDPSLFTAPYDAALSQGLKNAGLTVRWAARCPRAGEHDYLAAPLRGIPFYKATDRIARLPAPLAKGIKGLAHVFGMVRVVAHVIRRRPGVVHFQWLCVPVVDVIAILLLRRLSPIVVTCHDTTPFNGDRFNPFQRFAFDLPLRLASKVIVHTRGAKSKLLSRGLASEKVAIIPHGPLSLPHGTGQDSFDRTDPRYTFVLFGELKPYKGIDLLVEAAGRLSADVRRRTRIIVAGRAQMDLTPLQHRCAELGLGDCLEIRPGRLSEAEMQRLFAEADAFVFPYRQIDASGVFFLVSDLRKWIVASKVGIFAESIQPGRSGTLVAPEDVAALSDTLRDVVERRPVVEAGIEMNDWDAIGRMTRDVYRDASLQRGSLVRRYAS